MAQYMDKATLLDKIRTRQAEFEGLLAPLDEAQMTKAGVNGEWSIKDVLAHITAWQKRTIERLQAAAEQRELTTTPVANDEEMNALNARFYEENKVRPLAEILSDWKATHARLLEAVQAVSEEDLNDAQKFVWNGGDPLWENVAANTYEHIDEHIGAIEQWLVVHR